MYYLITIFSESTFCNRAIKYVHYSNDKNYIVFKVSKIKYIIMISIVYKNYGLMHFFN